MSCPNADYIFVCRTTIENYANNSLEETIAGGVVFLTILLLTVFLDIDIPFITNKISLNWRNLIPFFILSISGSVIVMGVSHFIGKSRWLEYIGKNSLVFYMFNTIALNISVKFLVQFIRMGAPSIIVYISILIVTCLILSVLTKVLNTKYLCFSLGKF